MDGGPAARAAGCGPFSPKSFSSASAAADPVSRGTFTILGAARLLLSHEHGGSTGPSPFQNHATRSSTSFLVTAQAAIRAGDDARLTAILLHFLQR